MNRRVACVCVILAVLAAFITARPAPATAGQAGAKAYKGTITLKRTLVDADNNMNESVQLTVVLASTGDTASQSAWRAWTARFSSRC